MFPRWLARWLVRCTLPAHDCDEAALTTPFTPAILTEPLITVAEFRASPTWLDSDNLIEGGTQAEQDAELYNVLLRASTWADNYCRGTAERPWFKAHTVIEQCRTRINRDGRLFLHPSDNPVRDVTGLAFGADFQNMTVLSDLSQTWVEDGRGIIVSIYPNRGSWAGTLEFGSTRGPGGEVFVQYQYTAGYACTTLAADVTAGASSLTVTDGTGFVAPSTGLLGALGGSVARIWDPGVEEAVNVASGYTTGSTTVPLAAALRNNHKAGAAVSELPSEVRQAIVIYAVALMMRQDVSEDEPFGSTPFGPSLRQSAGPPAGGLVHDAEQMLNPYRRVR
jgi:hypothetical protein